jgi:hypothetical protein
MFFLSSRNILKDNSLDIDYFKHAISWLKVNYKYKSEIIIHLMLTNLIKNDNL